MHKMITFYLSFAGVSVYIYGLLYMQEMAAKNYLINFSKVGCLPQSWYKNFQQMQLIFCKQGWLENETLLIKLIFLPYVGPCILFNKIRYIFFRAMQSIHIAMGAWDKQFKFGFLNGVIKNLKSCSIIFYIDIDTIMLWASLSVNCMSMVQIFR